MYIYPKITKDSLEKLLFSRFSSSGFLSLKDLPHPHQLKDMKSATDRIIRAIEHKEKIILIGDYDVDGVVSTTIMKLFFGEIGVDLDFIVPNRFRDGYGLSPTLIPRIRGYDLVITVDNGISAVEASKMCQEMGIDLIITDHHIVPSTVPEAYAIIDQKQDSCTFPYNEICGAQIAWYLIASINSSLGSKVDIKSYIELVAIAIVADMMPLLHINRAMVLSGLKLLSNSHRPSIRAFKEHLQKELFTGDDIGFQIAPILNSAGRLEDASLAVEFLMSPNIYESRVLLEKLVDLNNSRKLIEQSITSEALNKVDSSDEVLVISGDEWHEGVLGIVAARVSREHSKPTIILTKNTQGELKGSGRSFGSCDLFDITNSCREYLLKFGGHKAAIGLSLVEDNLEEFKRELSIRYSEKKYTNLEYDPDVVGRLNFDSITFELTDMIKKYEPFGQSNQKPKFMSRNVTILQVDRIGKDKEHLRFLFGDGGIILAGVKFKTNKSFLGGESVDILYTINENHFRGDVSLQLLIFNINISDNLL